MPAWQIALIVLAAAVLLAPLVVVAHVRLWRRVYRVGRAYDEVHDLPLDDGGRCTLLRYKPRGTQVAGAPPVVLCHGLATTRYCLDLDDQHSLALSLANAGRDVWLLELRGRGLAREHGRGAYSFDHYVRHDVPTAVAHVLRSTRSSQIDWVGYSMGGMVMYAFLATEPGRSAVRALVAISSPAAFGHQRGRLRWALTLDRALGHGTGRWFDVLAPVGAPFAGYWYPRISQLALNPLNFSRTTIRRVMVNVLCSCPPSEMRQFYRFAADDRFDSDDGSIDYRKQMAVIRTPASFIAGSDDHIAPEAAVRAAHDAIGSPRRAFRVIGKAGGAREEYGHTDMVLGDRAREEVFPHVLSWLEGQDRLEAESTPALAAE